MIDLYLKADTENELIAGLAFARNGDLWREAGEGFALDIIGVLYNDNAVYNNVPDERGEFTCISPPTLISGFHANIRCNENIKSLIPAQIIISAPIQPQRKWL